MASVLVIDDHMEIRLIFSRCLRDAGFEVATANDGIEGLAAVEKHRPDLILLDVFMPRMNGAQFLERLNENSAQPQIPVVLLSAVADSPEVKYAATLGISRFVRKGDFTLDELVRIVNETLPDSLN